MDRKILFPMMAILFTMGYIAGKYAELSWMKYHYYIIAIFGSWLLIKIIEENEIKQEEEDGTTRNT